MNRKNKTSTSGKEHLLDSSAAGLDIFDLLLAPLFGLAAAVWSFFYVGTSIEWDDLLYMNLSQYTTQETWVLNRYGHIYLQKFFMWVAGDALAGTKIYWCFLFFGTCILVYWCAKMLAGKKNYIIGLIAVLLFCMQPLFARYVGCTFSDLTVMFLVMLASFVYLAFFTAGNKHRHLIVMVLGLIFFWTVKSKETGVCMGVFFFALGKDETDAYRIRQFIKDIGWVCLGMMAGCILLMTLDMIFLGDFWFSVRPSSVKGLMNFNFREPPGTLRPVSWYAYFSMKPLLAPFLLYLLVGYKGLGRHQSTRERLVWLLPLLIILFIRVVRSSWHIIPRYFAPVIPVMCIWAAQFFRFNISGSLIFMKNSIRIPKAVVASVLILAAFIIICVFMSYSDELIEFFKLQGPDVFYTVIIMSMAITILLMVAGFSRQRGLAAMFLSSLCFFLIIYFPLKSNLTSLQQRVVAKKSEWRYEPYRVFADELRFDKDVRILVSKDIHKRSWMLGRQVDGHCWMFNIFFNQKFDSEQFIDGSWEDILKGDYDYAFLTWRDWKGIGEKHNVEQLRRNYTLKTDRKTQLILLKKM